MLIPLSIGAGTWLDAIPEEPGAGGELFVPRNKPIPPHLKQLMKENPEQAADLGYVKSVATPPTAPPAVPPVQEARMVPVRTPTLPLLPQGVPARPMTPAVNPGVTRVPGGPTGRCLGTVPLRPLYLKAPDRQLSIRFRNLFLKHPLHLFKAAQPPLPHNLHAWLGTESSHLPGCLTSYLPRLLWSRYEQGILVEQLESALVAYTSGCNSLQPSARLLERSHGDR